MANKDVLQKQDKRFIAGARMYAKSDKSNPFALATALSQIKNGIVDNEAMFDAEVSKETRTLPKGVTLSNGDTSFQITVFKNTKRP